MEIGVFTFADVRDGEAWLVGASISEYAQGIIATTGCPSGEVQTRLRLGQRAEAVQAASDYRDMFGAENFFLELMDHGLPIERYVQNHVVGAIGAGSVAKLVHNCAGANMAGGPGFTRIGPLPLSVRNLWRNARVLAAIVGLFLALTS